MSLWTRYLAITCVCFTFSAAQSHLLADDAKPEKKPELNQKELEQRLADQLSGAALVGSFTIAGQEDKPAHQERYELDKVEKVRGDLWTFTARIKYGNNDVKVPLNLTVLWAGDTPVITLTDLTIPGLGTFTARVMFYGDRYAGTWQHGEVGGHMYGKIEKIEKAEKKNE